MPRDKLSMSNPLIAYRYDLMSIIVALWPVPK